MAVGPGAAADPEGNIYFMTGDGSWNARTVKTNFGNSFVKLRRPAPWGLALASWFTSAKQPFACDSHFYFGGLTPDCSAPDEDLGSAGVPLVPGSNLLIGGGKMATLFVLDRRNLAGLAKDDANSPGRLEGATDGHIHGSPVFWNSPDGQRVYVWGEDTQLRSYKLEDGRLEGSSKIQSSIDPLTIDKCPSWNPHCPSEEDHGVRMPGGMLTISANGSTRGTGIVWASYPKTNANKTPVDGILYAFNAETLEKIWSSDDFRMDVDNRLGLFAKYVAPTVANGKVFMAAWSEDDPDHLTGRLQDLRDPTVPQHNATKSPDDSPGVRGRPASSTLRSWNLGYRGSIRQRSHGGRSLRRSSPSAPAAQDPTAPSRAQASFLGRGNRAPRCPLHRTGRSHSS